MDKSLQKSKELVTATKVDLEIAEKELSGLRQNQKCLNQQISFWKEKSTKPSKCR